MRRRIDSILRKKKSKNVEGHPQGKKEIEKKKKGREEKERGCPIAEKGGLVAPQNKKTQRTEKQTKGGE